MGGSCVEEDRVVFFIDALGRCRAEDGKGFVAVFRRDHDEGRLVAVPEVIEVLAAVVHARPFRMVNAEFQFAHEVAGLGNIYVDEALFRAGIRPMRHSDNVTKKEAVRLHEAIVAVLQEGLEHGGTTIRNFISGNGKEGQNQDNLRVYGREGTPCTVCGTTIEYTKLNGRGTHYCPKCQT